MLTRIPTDAILVLQARNNYRETPMETKQDAYRAGYELGLQNLGMEIQDWEWGAMDRTYKGSGFADALRGLEPEH